MHDVIAFLLGIVLFAICSRAAYASVKAAANRKPGVGFIWAMHFFPLLFLDSPYTEEGLKWATTFQRCFFGLILAVSVAILFGWLTK
jgi:hypothetical protein